MSESGFPLFVEGIDALAPAAAAAAMLTIETSEGELHQVPSAHVRGWKTIDNILADLGPLTRVPLPTVASLEFQCILAASLHLAEWDPRGMGDDNYLRMLEVATYLDVGPVLDRLVPWLATRLLSVRKSRYWRFFRDLLQNEAIYSVGENTILRVLTRMRELTARGRATFDMNMIAEIETFVKKHGSYWSFAYASVKENAKAFHLVSCRFNPLNGHRYKCPVDVWLDVAAAGSLTGITILETRYTITCADATAAFYEASRRGHADMVIAFLQRMTAHARLGPFIGSAMSIACQEGHINVIRALLARASLDNVHLNGIFDKACELGHTAIVELLLEYVNLVDARISSTSYTAILHRRKDVLKTLFAHAKHGRAFQQGAIDTCRRFNMKREMYSFVLAETRATPGLNVTFSGGGGPIRTKTVQCLLEDGRADPTADSFQVLRDEVTRENPETVRLFLSDARVATALTPYLRTRLKVKMPALFQEILAPPPPVPRPGRTAESPPKADSGVPLVPGTRSGKSAKGPQCTPLSAEGGLAAARPIGGGGQRGAKRARDPKRQVHQRLTGSQEGQDLE
jgi:hypothetical protein